MNTLWSWNSALAAYLELGLPNGRFWADRFGSQIDLLTARRFSHLHQSISVVQFGRFKCGLGGFGPGIFFLPQILEQNMHSKNNIIRKTASSKNTLKSKDSKLLKTASVKKVLHHPHSN